jgi:hypothetical protein
VNGDDRRPFSPGAPNWAFLPLYPMAVRVLGGDFALSGMLVSHAALLGRTTPRGRASTWRFS